MIILGKDNIELRSFTVDDQIRLAELCNNIHIWNNVRDYFPHPYTEKDAGEFISMCGKENSPTTFAIVCKGELAGCIGLVLQTDVYRMSAEIGYWIGEPYWGLGIATQAVELLTDYGFNQLGLVRIYSGVFDFNAASRRVLEKAGFKLEGVFEKSVIKNGKILDEFRYAKLNDQLA
ncbi:MAG: GNAT family protein [Prolixibacteraceae bacterium]